MVKVEWAALLWALLLVVNTRLESVVDDQELSRMKQRKIHEEKVKVAQDRRFPGERERIETALDKLKGTELRELVKKRLKSMEGLEKGIAFFTEEVMPKARMQYCYRCEENFNEAYDKVCRVEHPDDEVHTIWNTSKMSYDLCDRCGKAFNVDGYHSWKKNAPIDEGPYCFVGAHSTEPLSDDDEDDE